MRKHRIPILMFVIPFLFAAVCAAESDVSIMTGSELTRLIEKAQNELAEAHTVSEEDAAAAFRQLREAAESYYDAKGVTVSWDPDGRTCLADWDYLSVTLHASFDKGSGITHTDSVSAMLRNGELIWLKCGAETVLDVIAEKADENGLRAFRSCFPNEEIAKPLPVETPPAPDTGEIRDWVLNTSSRRFHDPSCPSSTEMKAENRSEISATRQELLDMGYKPCGRCNP